MKFKNIAVGVLSSLALVASTYEAQAEVKLHPLFTDNMVLQRDKVVPIWGTARAGENVEVSIGRQRKSTQAGADGAWRVALDAMPIGPKQTLTVRGDNAIVLGNIAIGDVYICSGQSNMEWPVAAANNAQAEIATANFPNIRLLTVPKKIAGTPQKGFGAPTSWKVCSPESIPQFSAVGYFFGRELHQKTGIPIGLIDSSWGGTIAQTWMSRDSLLKREDLREETLRTEQAFTGNATGTMAEQMKAWWSANDAGERAGWSTPVFDDATWKTMKVPGGWENNGVPDFDGVMWFRQTIEIPAAWADQDLTLHLGAIDDRDTTYFNGEAVGATDVWNQPREYKIPAALVRAGRATVAVRVLDTGGGGGFMGEATPRLELAQNANEKISFAPQWKYQVSVALKDVPLLPADVLNNPNRPTLLFNGMIAPLIPFSVRGAIWYQGESNAGNSKQYQTLFPELIKDWRTQWNAKQDGSEFGFYFVQLANFMARTDEPVQSGWAGLREAQTLTLSTPRTGMASAIDIGEAGDIHPKNKQDVGKRLALVALAKEYGQDIEYSGPMFSKMTVVGNVARIDFSHAQGLKLNGVPPLNHNQEPPDMPFNFWAYGSLNKFVKAGVLDGNSKETYSHLALTRYEFAVAIARLKEKLGRGELEEYGPQAATAVKVTQLSADLEDTLLVLEREFAVEIQALSGRGRGLDEMPRQLRPQLKGFAIQGQDGKWVKANARIQGESVQVWSGEVLNPKAVRYAWANNPDVNLVNAADLPAVSFRTDAP